MAQKLPCFMILMVVLLLAQTKILEVTETNLQIILQGNSYIPTLLHHPLCQKSRIYKNQFLEVANTYLQHKNSSFGLIDCQQEQSLCKSWNVTTFPSLFNVTNSTKQPSNDPWQFLQQQKKRYSTQSINEQILASRIAKILRQKSDSYVTIVLQQEGLQILNTVEKDDITQQFSHITEQDIDKIFYLQENGIHKNLFNIFFSLNGNQHGCWIFEGTGISKKHLKKYSCGIGDNSKNLLTLLQAYKTNQLEPIESNFDIETKLGQANEVKGLSTQQFRNLIKYPKNSLIYIWSSKCLSCFRNLDVKILRKAVQISQKNPLLKFLKAYEFNLDLKDLPSQQLSEIRKIHIDRLPTILISISKDQRTQFNGTMKTVSVTKWSSLGAQATVSTIISQIDNLLNDINGKKEQRNSKQQEGIEL